MASEVEVPLPVVGSRVRCEGLKGAAELNGCLGYVVEYSRRARESEDGRKRGQAGGGRQGA